MMQDAVRRRIRLLKEKWPAYKPLLDFYLAVREAQEASDPQVQVATAETDVLAYEGFTGPDFRLNEKGGFPIDTAAARQLFAELCRVGEAANTHFATHVRKIEKCLSSGALELDALLASWGDDRVIEQAAAETGLDSRVLSFLVTNSVRPSIERARNAFLLTFEPRTWRKVQCPVCGSLPTLSLLKGEPVQRFSLCSRCGCEWPVDRVSCSICGDNDKKARWYFHGENQEAHRIDLCDNCRHYIKTIDVSILETADPCLEDLATLHLDVIAVKKGYSRAVLNTWYE